MIFTLQFLMRMKKNKKLPELVSNSYHNWSVLALEIKLCWGLIKKLPELVSLLYKMLTVKRLSVLMKKLPELVSIEKVVILSTKVTIFGRHKRKSTI